MYCCMNNYVICHLIDGVQLKMLDPVLSKIFQMTDMNIPLQIILISNITLNN